MWDDTFLSELEQFRDQFVDTNTVPSGTVFAVLKFKEGMSREDMLKKLDTAIHTFQWMAETTKTRRNTVAA